MSLCRLSAFAKVATNQVRLFSVSGLKASEEQPTDFFPPSEEQLQQRRRKRPGINSVQLLGGVADNPLQRIARNGKEYCTFNMFTNIEQRRVDGSITEHADLHSVVAHGPLSRYIVNNVTRGSRVIVQGRLTYTGGQQGVSGQTIPRQCVINAEIVQPIARAAPNQNHNN